MEVVCMARAMYKQRGNGQGSIIEIKPRAGKPKPKRRFRARVTVGWDYNPETGKSKQILKDLGYYETRAQAEAALAEYFESPYDLSAKDMTFKECYEAWFPEYEKRLSRDSARRSVINAFEYMTPLYNMRMRDIKESHIRGVIDNATRVQTRGKDKGKAMPASACTKERMKSVLNLMYDWVVNHDIVNKNYARGFHLDKEILDQIEDEKREINIFTNEEVQVLWDNVNKYPFVDMLLINIYEGWRPQELAILKVKDVDLQRQTITGGIKTKASKDRTIPIHPLVKNLIANRYNEAIEMGSEYLFNDPNGQRGTNMTYDKWQKRFNAIIEDLKLSKHHPHEARHHFISSAKAYGVDEYLLKRIVGHKIKDVTEDVYTHRFVNQLAREIRKIKKFLPEDIPLEEFDDSEFE